MEYRVGNLVHCTMEGREGVRVLEHVDFFEGAEDYLSGVPVTPKMLIRMGLVPREEGSSHFRLIEEDACEGESYFVVEMKYPINGMYCTVYIHSPEKKVDLILCNLKYAHQVQNLIYDLTDIELKVEWYAEQH